MKRRNNKRVVKWILLFAIPEIVFLIFIIYGFITHNTTCCEMAGIFAMIYIWIYFIIYVMLVPEDKIDEKHKKDKD